MSVQPAWGLAHVVPEEAVAAWGARLIVTQQGTTDLPPDRQGGDGGEHTPELFDVLNERFPMRDMLDTVELLLRGFYVRSDGPTMERVQMKTREAEDFILHHDDRLIVHANTNASAGYCYVTAWLYP